MRVHELAKTLKISSKELLEKLGALGVDAKSHMARLDEKTVAMLKADKKKMPSEEKKPPPAPPVKEARRKASVANVAPVPAPSSPPPPAVALAEPIRLDFPISVGALAAKLNVRVAELIKSLMGMGVFANVNQLLGEEVVIKLGAQLGMAVEKTAEEEKENLPSSESEKKKKKQKEQKEQKPEKKEEFGESYY